MTVVDELIVEHLTATDCNAAIVVLHGPISVHTYEKLEAELDKVLRQNCFKIVLDLADVRYVSSAGAGVMMNVLSQVRDAGGDLVLINLTNSVREIFELLNLNNVLPIADDLPSALKRFGA
ncbi:MAG TPA: STAS domain-containing protein [Planctomycetota bacterium]|nr:STAS domain-containing protein [Planctomycetota bacterium]